MGALHHDATQAISNTTHLRPAQGPGDYASPMAGARHPPPSSSSPGEQPRPVEWPGPEVVEVVGTGLGVGEMATVVGG